MNKKSYKILSTVLAAIAAFLALMAAFGGFNAIGDAGNTTKMVETWRMVGFLTFSALFTLLAVRPLHNTALWLIVIANKLILTVVGFMYGQQVTGALNSAAWDASLTVILITGFIASCLARRKEEGEINHDEKTTE